MCIATVLSGFVVRAAHGTDVMPRPNRRPLRSPRLTLAQIVAWIDVHRSRTGAWPTASSGPIPGTGLTWRSVNQRLGEGVIDLPRGGSLPSVIWRFRGGMPTEAALPVNSTCNARLRLQARDDSMRREREQGAILAELAKKYGVSVQRVYQIVGKRRGRPGP